MGKNLILISVLTFSSLARFCFLSSLSDDSALTMILSAAAPGGLIISFNSFAFNGVLLSVAKDTLADKIDNIMSKVFNVLFIMKFTDNKIVFILTFCTDVN